MKVVAVIPAYNEAASIGFVLKALPATEVDSVIVVDNGSEDRTAEEAAFHGAIVVREPERGYGAACLAGIAAVPEDTDAVLFLDADFSDFPEEAAELLAPIRAGAADFVIGTRMALPDARAALLPQARFGNRLAVFLVNLIWGSSYTDLGPFRAIRRDALRRLGMRDRNFGWTVEMQVRASRSGLRTLEVPVRYRRRVGVSKITGTFRGTLMAGFKILYTIARYALS